MTKPKLGRNETNKQRKLGTKKWTNKQERQKDNKQTMKGVHKENEQTNKARQKWNKTNKQG